MNIARSLRAMLATSVCLLPLPVLAQTNDAYDIGKPAADIQSQPENNWIDIGGQYRSAPSADLGRFSGNEHPGFYGLGDFQLRGRDPWDSGGTLYWQMNGNNLGQWDRSFDAKAGQQGTWGVEFSYQGIPYYGPMDVRSIWTGNGSLVPRIAPGSLGVTYQRVAPAVTSLGVPYVGTVSGPAVWQPVYRNSPAANLFDYNINTRRDAFTGIGHYQWGDWTITGTIEHEHKTGYKLNSLNVTGTPAPTASSAAIPTTFTSALGYFAEPIDYDTDRYDLTAKYGTSRMQVQLSYTFNNFTDNMAAFNALNPYAFTPTTTFGSPAAMFAPYAQPPSNSAHQLKAMFGYNFTPTTRLMANFGYDLMLQNQSFDMASGNPAARLGAVSAASLAPLEPRSSLDGAIQNFFGNVALTAQPLQNLDLRVAYTIDDRVNQTPSNLYVEDHNGVVSLTPASLANLPFSYNNQQLTAEAGYRILPQTKLIVNDTIESTWRDYANASFVTANTTTVKIRSLITSNLFGSLSYSYQDRDAHNYNNNLTWQLLGDSARDPAGFLTYFEASRKRNEVKGILNFTPLPAITTSLVVKFDGDTYPQSTYGLRSNHNLSIGPDVNWQPMPTLTAHAFYTYQQIYYDQASIYESSTTAAPTASSFVVPWANKTTNSVHTAGITVDWQAVKSVLKFGADFNLSYGDTAYALGDSVIFFGNSVTGSQITAGNINTAPLPDVTSLLGMVSVHGEYTFRPNMTLIFGVAWERFTYKDFLNGTGATQYADLLLPGIGNTNSSVWVVGTGLHIRF